MIYSLIVDSSTKLLYICLVEDNNPVYEIYLDSENNHAENIVYKINQALEKANIDASNLNCILCGCGPGSYTGVRMAITVCKMLAVFTKTPLYTISTLRLMASGHINKKVLVAIDARRGNVFGCIINLKNNSYIVEEGLHSYDEIKKNEYDCIVDEKHFIVDPIYCLNNKQLVLEPHLLVPNYMRETEAERNLHDKKSSN